MKNNYFLYLINGVLVLLIVTLSLIMQQDRDLEKLYLKPWDRSDNITILRRVNHRRISPLNKDGTCIRQENVVYIKTHKTGSTTVQSIMYRYGFFRNLSFVLRRTNSHNGHIRYLNVDRHSPGNMFLPLLGEGECIFQGYNISAVHVVHNKAVFETFMNPGTKYITILRNPTAQFLSAFVFFKLYNGVEGHTIERKLLNYVNGDRWKETTFGKNSQSTDLGLGSEKFDNESEIKAFISRLDEEFDLVLINEYFDESMVLMARELCWSLEDVTFTVRNNRSLRKPKPSQGLLNKIRAYNRADYLLYEHFNKTFWTRIKAEGHGFWQDLKQFKRLQNYITNKCLKHSSVNNEHDPELIGPVNCDTYTRGSILFKHIFKKQTKLCKPYKAPFTQWSEF